MLKIRLIPSLLLRNGRCIKTIKFCKDDARDTGDPIKSAKVYDSQRADELLFLDIEASSEGRKTFLNVIEKVAEGCFMPLAVGGGIRSIEDIKTILKIGADKVAIGKAFVENLNFINEASYVFGSSTLVGIINYRLINGKYKVFINGKEKETKWEALELAKEMEKRGAGEIFLYSIDGDGTTRGYDIEIIKKISDVLILPVIACGGAGNLGDFVKVVKEGRASAVSAASLFHFTDQNLLKARAYMKNSGLNVRSI